MSWEIIRADQFCDSVRDGTHDTPKEVENGYKLVTAKHIRDGQVYPNEAYNISEKDYIKINERSKVEQWDVVMSMIGNGLGRTAVIKDKPSYAIKNLALFKIGNEVKAKWLHYFLSSEDGQGLIFNSLQGSGQPFISLNLLRAFPIPTPPYKTMENIIGHLEKFDDLIENNQKQIKLLEEAAQRLYKEWFVDLRFPGHETTPIINGIPEGWRVLQFSEVFDFVRGKSYTSKELSEDSGLLMVNLKNISSFGGYKRNAEKRFLGSYKENQTLTGGDVVMGVTDMTQERRLVGYVAMIPSFNEKATFSMDLIKLIPKSVSTNYLYSALRFGGYGKRISPLANGVNVLHLKPESMMKIEMIVPDAEIMKNYDVKFESKRLKIEALEKQIELARQARDRLLPKLMSGELEV